MLFICYHLPLATTRCNAIILCAMCIVTLERIVVLVPAWDKGLIRYFDIFHYWSHGSNLHFRKTDKLSEGGDIRVCPTLGSGFSRYRVMVSSQGVLSRNN